MLLIMHLPYQIFMIILIFSRPTSYVYFFFVVQNKGQIPGDSLPDPSHFMRNGSSPGSNFTGKLNDSHNMVTSAAASGAHDQIKTDPMASMCFRSAETPANITSMINDPPVILPYSLRCFLRLEAALVTYECFFICR